MVLGIGSHFLLPPIDAVAADQPCFLGAHLLLPQLPAQFMVIGRCPLRSHLLFHIVPWIGLLGGVLVLSACRSSPEFEAEVARLDSAKAAQKARAVEQDVAPHPTAGFEIGRAHV